MALKRIDKLKDTGKLRIFAPCMARISGVGMEKDVGRLEEYPGALCGIRGTGRRRFEELGAFRGPPDRRIGGEINPVCHL